VLINMKIIREGGFRFSMLINKISGYGGRFEIFENLRTKPLTQISGFLIFH